MKKVCLDLSSCKSIGDTLCATPVLRKLAVSYNQKIYVISNFLEIFKNNPYVERHYTYGSYIDIDNFKNKYIYHSTFDIVGKKNERGIEYKHNVSDIRQYHAISLGFMLTQSELECEFYPDPYIQIENLPEKYIVIHPVQSWASRTWNANKWMKLCKMLNENNISVISIGKESSETGFFNVDKPIFNFNIENGLNLMNKTTLSQAYHIINKSLCFVTMDSGLLHLAGTTNTHIIQLGSSINPEFRKPYRNGSNTYKYDYVMGNCDLFCASDMKYGIKEWGNIQGIPPLIGCLENKNEFECHPPVNKVYNKIIEVLNGK